MTKPSQRKAHHQRHSTKLDHVGSRGETIDLFDDKPRRPRTFPEVDVEKLLLLTEPHEVIVYARTLASPPFERKEVFDQLRIDKSTWSKIEDGTNDLPVGKIEAFCRIVRNRALAQWIAHRCEFDARAMRLLMDDKDRVIAEQAQTIERLQHEREIERQTLADFVKRVQS